MPDERKPPFPPEQWIPEVPMGAEDYMDALELRRAFYRDIQKPMPLSQGGPLPEHAEDAQRDDDDHA